MQANAQSELTRRELITFAAVAIVSVLAVALHLAGAVAWLTFTTAGIAVAGLAWILGIATEEAGEAAGPRLSALLNATFGNAAEIIIVILAVRAGLIDVAKASIIGSVIGNLLLILGVSFFASGIRHGRQEFDARVAGVNATMLVLATASLGLPSLFSATSGTSHGEEVGLSHALAALMLAVYIAYLYWSFQRPEERSDLSPDAARWSMRTSLAVLSASALATGILSEVLVDAIEPTIEETGISRVFIGLIIIPLVGNVAEHLAAVKVAWNGKLDFAMGIALNSALQVALAVSAVAVFAGIFSSQELTLSFTALEMALLAAATLIAGLIAANGTANWIEGVQLMAVYAMAGFVFWYL